MWLASFRIKDTKAKVSDLNLVNINGVFFWSNQALYKLPSYTYIFDRTKPNAVYMRVTYFTSISLLWAGSVIASAAKPKVFQGGIINSIKVSKCLMSVFSKPCQTENTGLRENLYWEVACRVWKVQEKVISQVLLQCQCPNPPRVTEMDLTFLRVMTHIHWSVYDLSDETAASFRVEYVPSTSVY